jgi:hypothetical protein
MQYISNSHPKRSAAIRPESLNHMLTEHYIMHLAMVRWDYTKHISYDPYTSR